MKVVFASLVVSSLAGDWEDYKAFFGKVYNGDAADAAHKATFETNMDVIEDQNSKGESLTFGANQFTDMTQAEFKVAAVSGLIMPENMVTLASHIHQGEALDSAVDWEKRGAVTPVKDQGQCGSCWAFSTIGGLEGAWEVATGSLVSMSEQELVDCSTKNSGCGGGWPAWALTYVESAAVCTEASYAYEGADGTCKSQCSAAIPKGDVTGYTAIGSYFGATVNDMKSALAKGPVSVVIEADQTAFQHYSGGILSSGCGSQLDHAVTMVGYGTENGVEYWRIKNSWASSWGDAGYIRLSTATNVCGVVNHHAVYPSISASVAV